LAACNTTGQLDKVMLRAGNIVKPEHQTDVKGIRNLKRKKQILKGETLWPGGTTAGGYHILLTSVIWFAEITRSVMRPVM
jgi:hypothetical protein